MWSRSPNVCRSHFSTPEKGKSLLERAVINWSEQMAPAPGAGAQRLRLEEEPGPRDPGASAFRHTLSHHALNYLS